MRISRSRILHGVALSAAGLAVLALVGFAPSAYHAWREDEALRRAHITYVRFPCSAMTTMGSCPAFSLDVFGNGTVIYQSVSDTRITGSYVYHVPDK